MRNLLINRRDYQALGKTSGLLLFIHLFLTKYIESTLGYGKWVGREENTFSRREIYKPTISNIVKMADI